MESLLTLTIRSTHYYLIGIRGGKLLVDAGWELPQFKAQMKACKVPFSEIKYVMFTHHHPDHAGLVQQVKDLSGAHLIIHEKQIPYLQFLAAYYEKKGGGEPVRVEKGDLVSPSRSVLHSIGIDGEIVETPGHSDDSLSLALDSGLAFIGDLTWPEYAPPESYDLVVASWKKLLALNVHTFYHSHVSSIPAERLREILGE
jgi:endoribonuclease LACTB2